MREHRTAQSSSTFERLFPDIIALVRVLVFPPRLSLVVAFVLLAATAAWADKPVLPASVPNIYDPVVRAHFQSVGMVNLGGNADFPVVLLMSTSEEEPQALLIGLDARNGKATWSLTSDPIILIVVVSDDTLKQRVYVDSGFADLGRASGAYTAVEGVNSPVLPEMLRAVFAAEPGDKHLTASGVLSIHRKEESHMRYKVLGRRTGLRVSELALGCGMFGTKWGYGAVPAQADTNHERVAIAWVSAKGHIPIIGPRTRAQLDDNLGALAVRLDPDQERRLDEVSAVSLGFPHELLTRFKDLPQQIAGGKADLLDLPAVEVA